MATRASCESEQSFGEQDCSESSKFEENSYQPNYSSQDENQDVLCYCRVEDSGEMIQCENGGCTIEWFYTSCLRITSIPKGKWMCPDCRNKSCSYCNNYSTSILIINYFQLSVHSYFFFCSHCSIITSIYLTNLKLLIIS